MSFLQPKSISGILALRKTSDLLEKWPYLYNEVMRFKVGPQMAPARVLCKETQLIIEGYPRSANSFAVRAFKMANDKGSPSRIATHLHSPASIHLGIARKIPTLVLIRKPEECIVSWIALTFQLGKLSLDQFGTKRLERLFAYWTRRYASFYNSILPYSEQYVSARFEDVTTDFARTIDKLNRVYSKNFELFQHTEQNVHSIFSSSKVHLSPSAERDHIKSSLSLCYLSSANLDHRERANKSYEMFIDKTGI